LTFYSTCNRGSTNPEYKSTPQDLPDNKWGEDSGMQAEGIQGKALARIKDSFAEKLTKVES
jgi:hypothetical protein